MEKKYSPDLTVTAEDFEKSGWRDVVAGIESKFYMSYTFAFSQAAQEACKRQQEKTAKVLWLFSEVCSMRLIPDCWNEPFKPMVQIDNGRSTIPSDFSQSDLLFFDEVLKTIPNSLLGARLADILWLRGAPKKREHAHQAIQLYTSMEITEHNSQDTLELWERGARLAKKFGKATKHKLDDIEAALLKFFHQSYTDDAVLVCEIGQLLFDVGLAKEKIEEIARRLYMVGKSTGEKASLFSSRSHFELALRFFKKTDDKASANDCLMAIADSFFLEAENRLSCENPSQMAAHKFYRDAIQAYRRIEVKDRESYGVTEKINAIRHRLGEAGQGSLGEMGSIKGSSIDISDLMAATQAYVSGKETPQDFLLCFIGLYVGPKYDSLKKIAEEKLKKPSFKDMVGVTHFALDGRVVACTPGIVSADDSNYETVLMDKMIENFDFEIALAVQGKILPALDVIYREQTITKALLYATCAQSPLIPHGREELVSKALWFGFEDDFGTSIHLLVPQLEHMIRTCLKSSGVHTTHLDKDGIETEKGLSSLLDMPEAEKILGQDRLFEFKALLTRYPANLRNEVAHGLLDDDRSFSAHTIYTWWLTLRWVIQSIVYAEVKKTCPTEESTAREV